MRIAIVTDWYLPRLGGIETQVAALARVMAERGHEVRVFTTTPGAVTSPPATLCIVESVRLPVWDLAVSPRIVGDLARALAAFSPDVIHAHASVVSPLAHGAVAAARRLGTGCVLTFHSMLHASRHVLRLAGRLGGLYDGVALTAVSETVRMQVASAFPRRTVDVLPNGVDLAFWQAVPRTPDGVQPPLVVSAMRLTRKKRPLRLLEAFTEARRRAGPARLVIAGDGPMRPGLVRRAAALGLVADVSLPGRLDPDALRRLYGQAAIFVLPSERESFGIAALEARAAGLPVIAMAGSGAVDFVQDGRNGLIAPDARGLALALGELIGEEAARARLATASVDLSRFDWSAVAAGHEAIYGRAASGAGTDGR